MLGFIGGTGPEGRGLATRFALAGEQVLIGSRDLERAEEAARGLSGTVPPDSVRGGLNADIAREADIVFVVVPYSAHQETLEALNEHLAGKIVVDTVAPLAFTRGNCEAVPVAEGSAALQAQATLPESKVVAALQTISAQELLAPEKSIDSDVAVGTFYPPALGPMAIGMGGTHRPPRKGAQPPFESTVVEDINRTEFCLTVCSHGDHRHATNHEYGPQHRTQGHPLQPLQKDVA